MNILTKQSKRDFIIATLEENYGEEVDNEVEKIQQLKESIEKDVETYGLMIVEKDFEAKMDKLKSMKKEIDLAVKYLESEKMKIKRQLATYLEDNGPQKIFTEAGLKYLKVGYTVKRNIDQDAVQAEDMKYLVEIDAELCSYLADSDELTSHVISVKRKPSILKDLKEDDPAISKQMNEQIKLVKKL